MKHSKLITKIIVFALIIYAGISLITLRARIEEGQSELGEIRRRVAAMEVANAEREYEIEHYSNPDVIANIARTRLGLVLPGEIVFYDGGDEQGSAD